jgi:hypothetical protein
MVNILGVALRTLRLTAILSTRMSPSDAALKKVPVVGCLSLNPFARVVLQFKLVNELRQAVGSEPRERPGATEYLRAQYRHILGPHFPFVNRGRSAPTYARYNVKDLLGQRQTSSRSIQLAHPLSASIKLRGA